MWSVVTVAAMQVVDEWFIRIRGLLMRASAAAGAAHLTLVNAYARLTALAAQLRQLQRAAAPALPALAGDPAAPQLGISSNEVPLSSTQSCMLSLQLQSVTPAAGDQSTHLARRIPRRQRSLHQRRPLCCYSAPSLRSSRCHSLPQLSFLGTEGTQLTAVPCICQPC